MRSLLAEQLVLHHRDIRYPTDALAHVTRQLQSGTEHFGAALDHLTPPRVHRRVHHDVRARRHQEVRALDQPITVDQIALQMKHRTLFEAGPCLVHADHADVGTRVHRPRRQVVMEWQMSAPGLVDDQRLVAFVAHRDDARQVGTGAVRSWD
jgi:hypothetical protein